MVSLAFRGTWELIAFSTKSMPWEKEDQLDLQFGQLAVVCTLSEKGIDSMLWFDFSAIGVSMFGAAIDVAGIDWSKSYNGLSFVCILMV
ncbi:hypothetical protein L2E82_30226 [Cichorium intybus]|uniref:Uncharacterized protein n=1 Tax=Cichorium intybus TaxID=13427 RepID=A0ACB9CZT4_CICIN|nr:hypothetical protein L2E82_30226 [Cichorium intybus]